MSRDRVLHSARAVVIVGSVLLLVLLALSWWKVSVTVAGTTVDAGTPGWSGIGLLAGACLVALLAAELVQKNSFKRVRALLALGAFAGVVASFFTGSASASYGNAVVVDTSSAGWPAYAALAVSAVIVVAAFADALVHETARLPLPPMFSGARGVR
jgi:hypothetical protein